MRARKQEPRRPLHAVIGAMLASPAFVSLAFAAEEHAARAAHEPHAAPSIATLFLPLVNFAIFVFIFFRYAWPAIRSALLERRRLVEHELGEADRVQREARAALAAVEALRARLADEGTRLADEMRAEGERERRALLESARASAERIRNDARLLAEQESSRAAQMIRAEIADQVVARVAAILRARLTDQDEARFVASFVGSLDAEAGR